MLKLQDFLKVQKDKHKIKYTIYLLTLLISASALSVWKLTSETLKLQWPSILLMQLVVIVCLMLAISHSYIKYLYKENDLNFKITKYDHDQKYGYLIHKENNNFYCTKCLYKENHNEIPLTENGNDKWICKVCDEPYFKMGESTLTSVTNHRKSKFYRELDDF